MFDSMRSVHDENARLVKRFWPEFHDTFSRLCHMLVAPAYMESKNGFATTDYVLVLGMHNFSTSDLHRASVILQSVRRVEIFW